MNKIIMSFIILHLLLFSNGVELAKALYSEGASVFGWDLEWNMNYNINRYSGHTCIS